MNRGERSVLAWVLWAGFALFVVYGTTIPFDFGLTSESLQDKVEAIAWLPLVDPDEGGLASIPDMVQNVLLFLPFGFLGLWALGGHRGARWLVVTLLGASLSLFVETLQLLTADRTTSATDLLTNTAGTFLGYFAGVFASRGLGGLLAAPSLRRLVTAESSYLVLVAALLAAIGAFEPFDFTLDVGAVASSVRDLVRNPFDRGLPRDELVSALRFALLAMACGAWLGEVGRRAPRLLGAGLATAFGFALELCQVIVASRSPNLRDVLALGLGAAAGAALLPLALRARSPWPAAVAVVLATVAGHALQSLHPFARSAAWNGVNWIPFLPDYERTTFVALSNFIENALVFLPLGFVLRMLFPRGGAAPAAAVSLALLSAAALEAGQGFVAGRHPDLTDVLGAVLGAALGLWACSRGWPRFRDALAEAVGEGSPPGPGARPRRDAGPGASPPWMTPES